MSKAKTKQRIAEHRAKLASTKLDGDLASTASTERVPLAEYPAIVRALVDPEKREKLRKISDLLKGKETTTWTGSRFESVSQAKCVTYGIGGPDFEVVSELLSCTEGVERYA